MVRTLVDPPEGLNLHDAGEQFATLFDIKQDPMGTLWALQSYAALYDQLQALVEKWEGMTCRTKCAEELREVLEGAG